MISAYYIFKRPAIVSDEPFRKSDESMTGVYVAQNHYSANIPQKINLAAFPRRINVDRVSIRKGAIFPRSLKYIASARGMVIRGGDWQCRPQSVGAYKRVRPPFTNADLSNRCFLSARLRSDSLYQPLFGSNPTESSGQKVSSGMLETALQASKGSEP